MSNEETAFYICPECDRISKVSVTDARIGFICPRCKGKIYSDTAKRTDLNAFINQDNGESKKKKKEKTLTESLERELKNKPKSTPCSNCGREIVYEGIKKRIIKCDGCSKFSIKPTGRAATDIEIINPKSTKMLKGLGILGVPLKNQDANDIIISVTTIIEKNINEHFHSFILLPQDIKFDIIFKISNSEVLEKIYWEEQQLSREELLPYLESSIDDKELLQALEKTIDKAEFQIAMKYVIGFAEHIFKIQLNHIQSVGMTLKCYNHNLLRNIKPVTDPKKYEEVIKLNMKLDSMLLESGYEKQKPSGCLFILISLLIPIIIFA